MALGDGVLGDVLPGGDTTWQAAVVFLAAKVKPFILDASDKLSNDDIQDAVAAAVEKYSKIKPAKKVVELVGNGTTDLALPLGWVADFSAVLQIEYPTEQNPESILDNEDDYALYASPAGTKIRLRGIVPAIDEAVWVTHTVPRDETNIPVSDVRALIFLAASICFEALANRYVDTSDPTIAADVVNYRTKSSEAASRAKALRKIFNEHVGYTEDGSEPAASSVCSNSVNYPGGGNRLTHGRRGRNQR